MAQDGSTIDDDAPVPGVAPYDGPAGGWGALRAVALAIKDQMGASAGQNVGPPRGGTHDRGRTPVNRLRTISIGLLAVAYSFLGIRPAL